MQSKLESGGEGFPWGWVAGSVVRLGWEQTPALWDGVIAPVLGAAGSGS